jgi:branched-chain amino acid transport system permease protein
MDIFGILNFLVSFAIMASIYAILSMGLNVHWGYTGMLNFGIAGFFAVGAYTSALFTSSPPEGVLADYVRQSFGLNQPFLVGLVAAAIVSGVLAVLIGLLTLRLSEGYLAISTIGIAESIRLFLNNEVWFANGPQGLVGLLRPLHGVLPVDYRYVYLVIVLVVLVVIYVALEAGIRSPWGRVLRAIREDEVMAAANGKNVFLFKLQSLALGAMIMGIGGSLYAHYNATIAPAVFTPLFGTFIIWAMLTLGGTGNNKGAILGAFIVWALWSFSGYFINLVVPAALMTRAPFIRYILIGLLIIFVLLKRPRGLIGEEKLVSRF